MNDAKLFLILNYVFEVEVLYLAIFKKVTSSLELQEFVVNWIVAQASRDNEDLSIMFTNSLHLSQDLLHVITTLKTQRVHNRIKTLILKR